jgi:hypothetical protein
MLQSSSASVHLPLLVCAGRSLSMQTSAAAVDVQQAPVVSQEQLQQGQEQGRQGRSHRRGSNGAGQQHGQGQQLQQQPLQLPEGVVVEEADTPVQATDYVFVDNLRLVRVRARQADHASRSMMCCPHHHQSAINLEQLKYVLWLYLVTLPTPVYVITTTHNPGSPLLL